MRQGVEQHRNQPGTLRGAEVLGRKSRFHLYTKQQTPTCHTKRNLCAQSTILDSVLVF